MYQCVKDELGNLDYIKRKSDNAWIPTDSSNIDYMTYLEDIKKQGMGIVEVDDCGTGKCNCSMWQFSEKAEGLLKTKYGSDSNYNKLLFDLRCEKYAKAKEGKFPYENKSDAMKIIDATPQEVQDAMRHIPLRR
tara:strand:- start:1025 stop:1426 length:402 start_codon:yes stop_codon:yes gene_type:complete